MTLKIYMKNICDIKVYELITKFNDECIYTGEVLCNT